jgi:hypothetical protein
MTFTLSFPVRQSLLLMALGAAVPLLSACDDPTAPVATEPNETAVVVVYALTGTPLGWPVAYSVPANQSVRMDGNLLFDVAFDIDAQGRVVLYPMELVVWPRVGIHRVGLLKADGSFDDVDRAPSGTYIFEEPLIVQANDVVVVESHESRICGFPFSPRLYAKFRVDEIDLSARSVRLRVTRNPNCGFRSFLEGIPAD